MANASRILIISIMVKEHVKIPLKESHLTSVNFYLSDTSSILTISLSFANENLEKLNWWQILMFIYTLFWEELDYFTTKNVLQHSCLLLVLSVTFLVILLIRYTVKQI